MFISTFRRQGYDDVFRLQQSCSLWRNLASSNPCSSGKWKMRIGKSCDIAATPTTTKSTMLRLFCAALPSRAASKHFIHPVKLMKWWSVGWLGRRHVGWCRRSDKRWIKNKWNENYRENGKINRKEKKERRKSDKKGYFWLSFFSVALPLRCWGDDEMMVEGGKARHFSINSHSSGGGLVKLKSLNFLEIVPLRLR